MLTGYRKEIEKRLERTVNNAELLTAIEMAKSDVVMNDLLFGKGATAEQFEDVVVKCLRILGGVQGEIRQRQ